MALTHRIHDYDDPRSIGFRFRAARLQRLVGLIELTVYHTGGCRIIDLGGTERYWKILGYDFLRSRNCTVRLVNPRRMELMHRSVFEHQQGDASATGLADHAFDLVHSNLTVEHVGDWHRMKMFAGEVRRLAPAYFVQTPNFWFPWEPHFGVPGWQLLPTPVRAALIRWRGWGHYRRAKTIDDAVSAIETCRLLDRRMFSWLFPAATIHTERFLGFPKSFIAVRNFNPPKPADAIAA